MKTQNYSLIACKIVFLPVKYMMKQFCGKNFINEVEHRYE